MKDQKKLSTNEDLQILNVPTKRKNGTCYLRWGLFDSDKKLIRILTRKEVRSINKQLHQHVVAAYACKIVKAMSS